MVRKQKWAQWLRYGCAIAVVLISFMWLFSPKILVFQLKFLSDEGAGLSADETRLILLLYRLVGANLVAIGLAAFFLTRIPIADGKVWAKRLLAGMFAVFALPYAGIALALGSPTFIIPLILAILPTVALWLDH